MRDASICGLGQAAPNPVDCVVKYFPHELAEERRNMTQAEARARRAAVSSSSTAARSSAATRRNRSSRSAKREGVEIPHLCYKEGLEAVGNCRACVVEINGERVLAPSCCRAPTPGMKVTTDSERARGVAEDGARAAAVRHARGRLHAPQRSRPVGGQARRRQAAFRGTRAASRRTSRTRPSPSTSTPASSARAACAPAATSRSTT